MARKGVGLTLIKISKELNMQKALFVFVIIIFLMSGCNNKENPERTEFKLSGASFGFFEQLYREDDKQFLVASDMNIYEVKKNEYIKISYNPIVEPQRAYEEDGTGTYFTENNLFVIDEDKYLYLGENKYYQLNKKRFLAGIDNISDGDNEFLIRLKSLNILIKHKKILLNINNNKKSFDMEGIFLCFVQDRDTQYIVFTKTMLIINNGNVTKYFFPYEVYGFSVKDDVYSLVKKGMNVISIENFYENDFEKSRDKTL
jgi:hypothetical protein